MLLHVTHATRYDYTPPVETAQHLAHLKPMNTASQRLVSHALTISPTPAQRSESPDVYGNTRAFFALESTHEELVVTAESVVDTSHAGARRPPWLASCPGKRCASASATSRIRATTRRRTSSFRRATCRAMTTSPPTRGPASRPAGRPSTSRWT